MTNADWQQLTVLVTGGTGSFGRAFVKYVLEHKKPKKLIIYSRDELKQHEMRQQFPDGPDTPVRYFIGDIRDKDRLYRAFKGVDIVVHAAALKQVPVCEYNPFEAVKTNVMGSQYIIDAAIDRGVKKVLAVSTDKAVNPINLYGATKLVAEKLFIHGNSYVGDQKTIFSCVRYGNVIGSRGSVVPLFKQQKATGTLTITDLAMTRFWITLEQGVNLVINAIDRMQGGEIFIPKIPSMVLKDFAETIAPGCKHNVIGIRPGEKLHEILISQDEARSTKELDDMFIIYPEHPLIKAENIDSDFSSTFPDGYQYSSDLNHEWLTKEALEELID